jgi:hypothetical protein
LNSVELLVEKRFVFESERPGDSDQSTKPFFSETAIFFFQEKSVKNEKH